MSAPQVGDVITTAEELDALPAGAAVAVGDEEGAIHLERENGLWHNRYTDPYSSEHLILLSTDPEEGCPPITLVYLPGQPPRPERVVKAEALREAAATVRPREEDEPFLAGLIAINGGARAVFEYVKEALSERADDIERGDQ